MKVPSSEGDHGTSIRMAVVRDQRWDMLSDESETSSPTLTLLPVLGRSGLHQARRHGTRGRRSRSAATARPGRPAHPAATDGRWSPTKSPGSRSRRACPRTGTCARRVMPGTQSTQQHQPEREVEQCVACYCLGPPFLTRVRRKALGPRPLSHVAGGFAFSCFSGTCSSGPTGCLAGLLLLLN